MPDEATAEHVRVERSALLSSLWVSVSVAVGALLLGVLSGTRIIVFDGAYMGIGIMLSWVSLRAASVSVSGPTSRFPFGRDALTPLVVLVQGLAIAGTLLFAAADAIVIIRDGGSVVNPLVILLYGAITAAAVITEAVSTSTGSIYSATSSRPTAWRTTTAAAPSIIMTLRRAPARHWET